MVEGEKLDRSNVTKFSFFRSFYDALELMSVDEGYKFVMALCKYAFEGELTTEFDHPLAEALYRNVIPTIGKSIERQMSGAKGGASTKRP